MVFALHCGVKGFFFFKEFQIQESIREIINIARRGMS